jgi:hypothetical protein
MSTGIRALAPFTAAQVESLNGYQHSGAGHPFTCGNEDCRGPDHLAGREVLQAAEDGWHCGCGYIQNWAWGFMADGSWREPGPWPLIVFTGMHGSI